MAGRPVGFFAQLVGVFLLGVLVARLVLDRENGWALMALIIPVLFVVLTVVAGWVRALAMVLLFTMVAVAMRFVLSTPKLGWSVFLLLALFAASVTLVSRVLVRLLRDRREARQP